MSKGKIKDKLKPEYQAEIDSNDSWKNQLLMVLLELLDKQDEIITELKAIKNK